MDRKPTIPLYVSLFAAAYIVLAFIIGYAITWLRAESSPRVNDFIIVAAASIATYWFTRRENRHFTKPEFIEIIIGSIVANFAIQVCSALIFVPNLDFTNKWFGFILILVGHALLIALSYSLLKKIPLPKKAV